MSGNHEMVSFQADSAARYLESKQEVKSFPDMIYYLLSVKKAFVDMLKVLQIMFVLGVM